MKIKNKFRLFALMGFGVLIFGCESFDSGTGLDRRPMDSAKTAKDVNDYLAKAQSEVLAEQKPLLEIHFPAIMQEYLLLDRISASKLSLDDRIKNKTYRIILLDYFNETKQAIQNSLDDLDKVKSVPASFENIELKTWEGKVTECTAEFVYKNNTNDKLTLIPQNIIIRWENSKSYIHFQVSGTRSFSPSSPGETKTTKLECAFVLDPAESLSEAFSGKESSKYYIKYSFDKPHYANDSQTTEERNGIKLNKELNNVNNLISLASK